LARNQLSASIHVELAYMEMASPTLEETAFKILNQETKSCLKIKTIYIAPFFMAQGAHLRNDVPLQVSALRQRYPEIQFELHSAIGEDPPVQHEMIERLGRLI
jgi:sirohydrochlorin cobaltochelatase